jgi:Gas vesicle synthesis protein GvpL/GvpF
MSESEQIKSRQNRHSSEEAVGFYVYCIVESIPAEKIAVGSVPTAIEDGSSLELINRNQLTAVVSRVSMSTFGEEALAARLSDAAWTAVRAMRHEQVIEHFAKRTSVVPLRFGTIYLDRSGIERMLDEKKEQLNKIIQRLQGREEWGVNVYCDRESLLDNITTLSPRLREMAEVADRASAGQSYLVKKKIEALRQDEAKAEIARAAVEIEAKLQSHSDDAARLRILKVETTEHGELKAKFAFLVPKTKFENFRKAAEELAREFEQSGIKIELTGPWPAYNFATA